MVDYALPPGMQTYDNLIYWANPILADIDARLGAAVSHAVLQSYSFVSRSALSGVLAPYALTSALAGYLPLTGGTLTGPLTLAGAPTVDLHAATKKYVDDAIAGVGGGSVPGYVTHALAGGI